MNIDTVKLIIRNPSSLISMLGEHGLLNWMPDKTYLSLWSSSCLGYKVNIDNPRTFCEKLQWLKLHDRNPLYTQLVDKYEVRKFVAEKIGEEHLIPLLGGPWDSVDEIDFDALPSQFVLKTTHDCGGIVICTNKGSFDREAAKAKLAKHLKRKYYCGNREWPYKNVKRRILAEKLLEVESGNDINDYKFFCFNGKVEFMKIDFDRRTYHRANYYDRNFTLLKFGETAYPPDFEREVSKPKCFDKMIGLAEKIARDFKFVRIDFYEVKGKVFFGEATFYPSSAVGKFTTPTADSDIGNLLEL